MVQWWKRKAWLNHFISMSKSNNTRGTAIDIKRKVTITRYNKYLYLAKKYNYTKLKQIESQIRFKLIIKRVSNLLVVKMHSTDVLSIKGSNRTCSAKERVLNNFANFTIKHLCWSLFVIKLQAYRPATLLKRDSDTGVFMNIAKFLRTPILNNICIRSLLEYTSTSVNGKLTWSKSSTWNMQSSILFENCFNVFNFPQ